MMSKELTICTLLITQLSSIALGRDFISEEYNTVIDEFDDGYFQQTKNNEEFAASPKIISQHSLHTNNPIVLSNTENYEPSNIDPTEDMLSRHRHHLDVLKKLRDVTSQLKDNLENKYARNQYLKPERFKKSDPNYVQVTNYYKGSNPFDNSENMVNKFSDIDPNEYNDYEDALNLAEKKEQKDLKKSSFDIPMMLVRNLLERNNVGFVEPPTEYATSPLFSPCQHGKNKISEQNKPYSFLEITEDQLNDFETPKNLEARTKNSRNGKDLSISTLFKNNTDYAINVKLKVDIDIPQLSDSLKTYKNKGKKLGAASDNAMDLYPSLITIPFPFFHLIEAFKSNSSYTNSKTSISDKNPESLNTSSKRNGFHKNKKVKTNAKVKHYKKKMITKDNLKQIQYDITTSTSTLSPQNESKKEIRENEIGISTENDRKNEVREIKEVYMKLENVTPTKTDVNENPTAPMILWQEPKLINETNYDHTTTSYLITTHHLVNNNTENINSTRDNVVRETNIVRKKRSLDNQTVGNLIESKYYAAKNEQNVNKTILENITDTVPTTEIKTTTETVTKIDENKVTTSKTIKNIVNENKNQTKYKLKASEMSLTKNKTTLLDSLDENTTELNLDVKNISAVTDSHIREDIPRKNIWEIILDGNRSIILANSESLDKDLLYWTNGSKNINESRTRRNILINQPDENAAAAQVFGEVDWSDVDAMAPAFITFVGKYMTGALTLCSDITCHTMKCEHRQCLHRWCSPKDRENKTGHCTHNKENKGNSESMATMEELDLPAKSVIAIADILESKLREKLFGKITLCSSKNCVTILADGKQFHKFRCSKKKLDRKEHCIEAKKILTSYPIV